MRVDEVAINLPHQYYSAIGEFMFRFSQLEYLLHELIWRTIDIDNRQGRVLTIGSDVGVLMATLNTICNTDRNPWVKSSRVKGEVGNILKVAKQYKPLRNQLAHGSWQYPENGDKSDVWMHYMKETNDQRVLPHARRLLPEELHKAAGKVGAATERAKRLISELLRDRPEPELRPPV